MRDHSFKPLNMTTPTHEKEKMEETEKTVLFIINYLSHNLPNPLFKIAYQTQILFSRELADKYSNCNKWKWYSNLIAGFLFKHKKFRSLIYFKLS